MQSKNTPLAIILLLFNLQPVSSQESTAKKMFSNYKESVYVEFADQYATVYKLGRVYDKGLYGYSLNYIDTLVKQPGTSDASYIGRRNQVTQTGNKYYLKLDKVWSKKDRPVELNPSSNIEKDYLQINKAYWLDAFIALSTEINSRFSMQHTSFRQYDRFATGHQDLMPYEKFKLLADNKINALRDSFTLIHTNFTTITNETITNIGTIDYSVLKDRLKELSEKPGGYSYFTIIFQKVCNYSPEWFYKLAEDLPGKKDLMFDLAYGSSVVKKLKAVNTDSPVKKEFIKHKRKDRRFTFQAIGVSIVGAALLGFALLSFIN